MAPESQEVFDLSCSYFATVPRPAVELECNLEQLVFPFIEQAFVSDDGENIRSLTIRLTGENEQGVLLLPAGFPGTSRQVDMTVCLPNFLVLTANSPLGARFRGSTGDTTRQLTVTEPDTYTVTVSNFYGDSLMNTFLLLHFYPEDTLNHFQFFLVFQVTS